MNDFLFEKGNLDSSVFGKSMKFKICDGITDMLHAINDSFDYFFSQNIKMKFGQTLVQLVITFPHCF